MNLFYKSVFVALFIYMGMIHSSYSNEESKSHDPSEKNRHIHGSHEECELPNQVNDIISCALQFHPLVKREELKSKVSSKLFDQASQVPNPTFNTRYIQGESQGKEVSELESNLFFEFELGGKKKARQDLAKSIYSHSQLSEQKMKAKVKKETILNLYRLRQVKDEEKANADSLAAFEKVIRRLKNLPRLNAEQEADLTLFEIAKEEALVEKAVLYQEERRIEHFFHIATGHSIGEIKKFIPGFKNNWPLIDERSESKNSLYVEGLKLESLQARNQLKLERSRAWPNLKVGPSLMVDQGVTNKNTLVGLSVSLPIPILNQNSGGKSLALENHLKSQKEVEFRKAEESHERNEQLHVYRNTVSILKATLKNKELQKRQNRIEKLYMRGLIASSVFLESVRQKLSYIKSRNERELVALSSLWNIYEFDGAILKEQI
ncbi:MAG: hypothetical protein CME60_05310 [Halobacteriovoraceae bacterium]|nr:hypothetical protein [Halobacteriovoraceae bacterium]